ncbi:MULTISPECIES: hypothetical protein [Mycolicibacterium]|jgi:hypothetical protein|uniref:Uncharacterized protein n=3 Tax=Mycolicibacterium TaxID=1866885 RepID=A0A378W7U4_9MYCO|nr:MULTISPECIES: hypothetical protein [Mycolicibacterium]KLI04566.1 hypothetical protein AA982_29300 [Mycolicibacterium senegalense]KLO52772.1 hypothetical protein ABW05_15895 [Mycolicibacterium senegalense]KMV18192.1 hypothetical protein ACT17_12920 [Mycolicibacterium conceptionense]MCV7336939.1 hypothetical protein [Mycolicibacterium senegalense]MCW1824028.1 hypothetical protein [Mycolicibacterium senegalense]
MNLLESIERGLDWLATPKRLPGHLEMETQRGKRLELEVVSLAIRMPVGGGVKLKVPVFVMLMPTGTSALQSPQDRTEPDDQ